MKKIAAYSVVGLALLLALLYLKTWMTDSFSEPVENLSLQDSVITMAGTDQPFDGTVMLADSQIFDAALQYYGGMLALLPVNKIPAAGFVLKADVEDGFLEGEAEVFIDLRSNLGPLGDEQREGLGYLLAYTFTPRIKVAEVNFERGKLNGPAAIYKFEDGSSNSYKYFELEFENDQPVGMFKRFYPNGQVKEEIEQKGTKPEGTHRIYYIGGELETEKHVREGKFHGDYITYYRNGQVRSESHFEDGVHTKAEKWYFPDGSLWREITYQGRYRSIVSKKEMYSDGSVKYDNTGGGQPIEGKPNGLLKEWYPDGSIESEKSYTDGVQDGPYKIYYKTSGQLWEEGKYKNGVLDGRFRKWWKNGEDAYDYSYVDGKMHGSYSAWYDNREDWEEATYENGVKQGHYAKWYNNGKLAVEAEMTDGQVNGSYSKWYDNGDKWEEYTAVNGAKNGQHQKWYTNKQQALLANYADGKRQGSYETWFFNGNPGLKAMYKDGKLDGKYENWRRDGNLIQKKLYSNGKEVQ